MTGSPDADRRATVAADAADAGAAVAADAFRTDLAVERKDGKADVVTRADREAQNAVIDVIESEYDEPIVGEESDALKRVPDSGPAWIVDPIDGTANFVGGARTFGTAVAAVDDGEPVASTITVPALEDRYRLVGDGAIRNGDEITVSDCTDPAAATVCPTFWWEYDERDQFAAMAREVVTRFADMRRLGCAQLELAMVATGALEGIVTNVQTNPWDTVAGVALVRAAGGVVTDLEGNRWRHDSVGLVASNGHLHDELLEAARTADEA
ncbi:inositol monophosphatase family protein [Natrarchaeobaculum aegyptiacum]|uniref:fructose-bisphosphatase n=1 Tax=Natrarchaeobaculum aegyptiacum TaxID=745377 RepID=A0A2Z2HWE9_9EURY|nr:inositol monophosphatase [Natrarchaeobaculum aegyptiacum]ARS91173.1 inositol monophosphatase [Natrarchaeobaculum aegyptiacum]